MTDHSHLIKAAEEGENKSLIGREDRTTPEEAKALLKEMLFIGDLIEKVQFIVSIFRPSISYHSNLEIKSLYREPLPS